ncbi:unnamed protein product [Rotaria sordida]|uniref:HD domain-containing protein n=1 Tax=Rotaria sordida TaxID=392033 RepID=A0A819WIG9_9BILA|nr:unnamed protein product [Rotaria sordida]CAF4126149.1 unnamed protein product [Rotaria sordida]
MSDNEESPSAKRYKSESVISRATLPKPSDSNVHNSNEQQKVFNDPIHGSIELHELLVAIIDTPEFQRLRRLQQLGATYYVFPGACHRRFEHSIGTCHLAGELLKHLHEKQPTLNITSEDVLCVQVAALCHDLGHGPFSHMFEDFIAKARPDAHWKHEQASLKMFDHMISKNNLTSCFEKFGLYDRERSFIKDLIYQESNGEESNQNRADKLFLYEIVSNKSTGIDVDKFDYIARDSYYLGTKISFEHMRFIKFCRVIKVGDGKYRLCLRDKEVNACYEIYRIRDQLHRLAYQHPVVKGIELLLREVLIAADDYLLFTASNGSKLKLSGTIDDMSAFSQVDDNVLTLIKHSTDQTMENAKTILERIERRNLYSYIGHKHAKYTEDSHQNQWVNVRKEIIEHCLKNTEQLVINKDDVLVEKVELSCGDRGEDPIKNMWFYTKASPDTAKQLDREHVSTFLPTTFREYDFRLYYKNKHSDLCRNLLSAFNSYWPDKKDPTTTAGEQSV